VAPAAPAHALLGATDGPIGLDANVRSIAAAVGGVRIPGVPESADTTALSQTLLRAVVAGRPAPWLAFELHAVEGVDYGSTRAGQETTPFSLLAGDLRYRALDALWAQHTTDTLAVRLVLDRANVTVALPWADVTLGRQAITFGKAYLWNPLDVFLPFDPRQFDQDYKPGVDAARVDVRLGRFSGLTLVGSAGRTLETLAVLGGRTEQTGADWFGSALLGRLYATRRGWDLSLQGGKVYGGYTVGGGASGEIGPIAVRLETVDYRTGDSPPLLPPLDAAALGVTGEPLVSGGASAVVGLGHRFESTLDVELEYFRNGPGDPAALTASLLRFASGGLLALSRNLLGAVVSYELLPILVGYVGGLVSLDDGSVQVQPRLVWSAADEIEVLAGAIVGIGPGPRSIADFRSEFGSFPDVGFVEAKWYF